MITFRIDNRDYLVDNIILPQSIYQNDLDSKKKRVEEILEESRPENKPSRDSILMLFDNFEDAKKHWTIQRNSKFYQTEIREEEILHIGDFNIVEEVFKNIDNEIIAKDIAKEYWNGKLTENPKKEIFVNLAKVEIIISNLELERKNAYAMRAGLGNPKIRTITNIYKMNRHASLGEQLQKAIEELEKAEEIEELGRKHREINNELKEKVGKALEKESQGNLDSESEQKEIDELAKKQEEIFNELAEKVMKNK